MAAAQTRSLEPTVAALSYEIARCASPDALDTTAKYEAHVVDDLSRLLTGSSILVAGGGGGASAPTALAKMPTV